MYNDIMGDLPIVTMKLDDGWPESEKDVFSSSSEDGSRKR